MKIPKAVQWALFAWAAAAGIAAIRFRAEGGILNAESLVTLAVNPLAAFRVAIQGPGPDDLNQEGQSPVGIL